LGEIYKNFERNSVFLCILTAVRGDQTITRHLVAAGLLRFFMRINYVRRRDMDKQLNSLTFIVSLSSVLMRLD